MKLTPIDIQQARFRVRLRGYDRHEVDAFLDQLTEDYEALIRENTALGDRIGELEEQMAEVKKREASLNNTIVRAQDLVEEIRRSAQKEAEVITREAELNAEQILRGVREEAGAIRREILDLEKQKAIFLEKIQSLIRTFQKLAEAEEGQGRDPNATGRSEGDRPEGQRDDNVRFLKPKP
jgi:cell division initiation protein